MNKPTMPDPVAIAYEGENGMPAFTPTMDGALSLRDGDALITTTQAEAYADARVKEVQRWQPIETAPKDGTPLLLFARWERAEASIRVIGWFIADEWISNSFIGQGKAVLVPSHWMPLPPFP